MNYQRFESSNVCTLPERSLLYEINNRCINSCEDFQIVEDISRNTKTYQTVIYNMGNMSASAFTNPNP